MICFVFKQKHWVCQGENSGHLFIVIDLSIMISFLLLKLLLYVVKTFQSYELHEFFFFFFFFFASRKCPYILGGQLNVFSQHTPSYVPCTENEKSDISSPQKPHGSFQPGLLLPRGASTPISNSIDQVCLNPNEL